MEKASLQSEIKNRLERFQEQLRRHGIEAALVVQKVDLFYLSGTDQDAHLWVPSTGAPLLMVRRSIQRAEEDSPLERIVPLRRLSELPSLIQEHDGSMPSRLGLEMDVLPAAMYLAYADLFPSAQMVDVSRLIRGVRMVKSAHEVSLIREAAQMADRLLEEVPRLIRESATETELAAKAEAFYRSLGHPGIFRMRGFNQESIYGHILAGPGGAVPSASPGPTGGAGAGPFYSQGSSTRRLAPHEPILVDYTANVKGYLSDQARIFSLDELPSKFHRVHRIMLEVQDAVAAGGKPGAAASSLYNLALGIVKKAGLGEGFMGYPQPVPFVAHGLGLELDEWPVIGRNSEHVLEKGMVFALEPKFIFPGEGVVGIENVFLVVDHGMEKLNAFPDEIVIV